MRELLDLEIELAKAIIKLKESHETSLLEEREHILNETEVIITKKRGAE